ncbi:MAG: lipocalin family protein [Cellvibrionaceae bacterium]
MKFLQVMCVASLSFLLGCVGTPEGIEPIEKFEVDRYLGQWYEIARLDHSFERGLEQVAANYSMGDDGSIKVINRGFDVDENRWNRAEGKAYFVGDETVGHLKVSFFGPFYGSYVIFDLGDDYQYSLVTSNTRSYLWLLSRSPIIDETLKADLIKRIADLGFDVEGLIFVKHRREPF